MATHRYILSAGHRNEDREGAYREIEWTYPQCVLIRDEIKRRGGEAWIIQEEDGDRDPSFCIGRGLQNAAYLCVELAKAVGGVDAYLSLHYEGVGNSSVRGAFGIYPDARSGSDIGDNNPLDKQMIHNIANRMATKAGMPKRTGWVKEPGLMSEQQTGVGGKGFRLGEFVGTIGFRTTTARTVFEFGAITNPTDAKMLWDDAWRKRAASAFVDGLEDTFGAFSGAEPQPEPQPEPEPTPEYEAASMVPALKDDRPFLLTEGGAIFVRADVIVEALRDTPRLKYAGGTAKVGPDIRKGERFATDYLIINNDGSLYWYTRWGTRVRYDDTRVIEGEAS